MTPLFKACLLVALVGALAVALTACSSVPVKSARKAPVDQSWTATAKLQKLEAERPRGQLEAWELKRPREFNQVEAQ